MNYLIFTGYNYYPKGGRSDFLVGCETKEEARKIYFHLIKNKGWNNWVQVVDFRNKKTIGFTKPPKEIDGSDEMKKIDIEKIENLLREK